jgi:hypothetical protein
MAKINMYLSEKGEERLKKVKKLGMINDLNVGNKVYQLELAVEIAYNCIEFLDDESFENVIGKKKRL